MKLSYIEEWTEARRAAAARYDELLAGSGDRDAGRQCRRAATSTTSTPSARRSARDGSRTLTAQGHRDRHPLPDPGPPAAGLRRARLQEGRFPAFARRPPTKCCRCRCFRNCTPGQQDEVVAAVAGYGKAAGSRVAKSETDGCMKIRRLENPGHRRRGLIGSTPSTCCCANMTPRKIVVFDNLVARPTREPRDGAEGPARRARSQGDIRDVDAASTSDAGHGCRLPPGGDPHHACAEEPRVALEVMCDGTFNVARGGAGRRRQEGRRARRPRSTAWPTRSRRRKTITRTTTAPGTAPARSCSKGCCARSTTCTA